MRIFLAGASGAIGRSLVPMLTQDGHEVVGMTRSQQKAQLIRDLGAEPVVADAFDADGLRSAVVDARPDAVIHELTDIPRAVDPRRFEEQFARNNRLRREGTRNLVAAAQAAGARRLIAQSIAFVYRYGGGILHSEEDPLAVDMGDVVTSVANLEDAVTGAQGLEGVVLRYGYFYGPGTSYAHDGAQAEMVRRRRLPIVGDGGAVFSFIHVDDAAAATVRALGGGSPGIYNVVDDEPAPVREWLPVLAKALGAKKPRRVPVFLARWLGGEYGVRLMTRSEGASNRKAKDELGLALRYPSWRRGFVEALG
jgi:nucleoside-diphosphate-sugar epimerase